MVGIYLARTLISDIQKVKFTYWTCWTGRCLHMKGAVPPCEGGRASTYRGRASTRFYWTKFLWSDVPSSSSSCWNPLWNGLLSLLLIQSDLWWSGCYRDWEHGVHYHKSGSTNTSVPSHVVAATPRCHAWYCIFCCSNDLPHRVVTFLSSCLQSFSKESEYTKQQKKNQITWFRISFKQFETSWN